MLATLFSLAAGALITIYFILKHRRHTPYLKLDRHLVELLCRKADEGLEIDADLDSLDGRPHGGKNFLAVLQFEEHLNTFSRTEPRCGLDSAIQPGRQLSPHP